MPDADISVVIPTFDRPALLRETVGAVLAQTVRPAEILVVDNGLRDDTEAMLRASFPPTVRHIRMEPLGLQAARNRGIAEARSPWIATLDDDDLYAPDCIQKVLPAIRDGRADLVFTDHRKFEGDPEDGNAHPRTNFENAPPGYWDGVARPERGGGWSHVGRFPAERLLRFNGFYPSTMFARKTLLERVGGYDPAVRGVKAEDIEFLTRAVPAASMSLVWEPLVGYRLHGGNASGGNSLAQTIGRWRIFEFVARQDRHGCPELRRDLAVDLPRRRAEIYDHAFRARDFALATEVAALLRPRDWTWRRRIKDAAIRLDRLRPGPFARPA